jgi:hypothetical protein
MTKQSLYDIILPLAIADVYTYNIPEALLPIANNWLSRIGTSRQEEYHWYHLPPTRGGVACKRESEGRVANSGRNTNRHSRTTEVMGVVI